MGKHKTEPVKPEAKVQVLVVQADGEKYLEKKTNGVQENAGFVIDKSR